MEPTGPNGQEELSYEDEQLQLILFNEMKEQNEKKERKERKEQNEKKERNEMNERNEMKEMKERKERKEMKEKQDQKIREERRFKDEKTNEYLESLKIDEARNKLTVVEGVSVGVELDFDEVTVEEMRRVRLLRFSK